MNMYEEFLATLEEVEQDATTALESAGINPGEPEEAESATEGVEEADNTAEEYELEDLEIDDDDESEETTATESFADIRTAITAAYKNAAATIKEKKYNEALKELTSIKDSVERAEEKEDADKKWCASTRDKVTSAISKIANKLKGEKKESSDAAATEGVEDPKEEFETPEVEEIQVPDENVLTAGNESLLLLDCLYATSTPDEFKSFLSDNKVELELYGLVDTDAIARESWADVESDESEVATEARNIVRLNREAQISRETARIAIGLAKQANDTLYKYYHKYSTLKREFRDKIYAKYGQRAQALARRSLMNSRSKASLMNSKTGSSIVNKIDSRIKQLDNAGRNKEAIQK